MSGVFNPNGVVPLAQGETLGTAPIANRLPWADGATAQGQKVPRVTDLRSATLG